MSPSELKEKRVAVGMSQFALAAKTGISVSRISKFENGYQELLKSEIARIEHYLKLCPAIRAHGYWKRGTEGESK